MGCPLQDPLYATLQGCQIGSLNQNRLPSMFPVLALFSCSCFLSAICHSTSLVLLFLPLFYRYHLPSASPILTCLSATNCSVLCHSFLCKEGFDLDQHMLL